MSQHMEALAKGNRVRTARAKFKRQLKTDPSLILDALSNHHRSYLDTAPVEELLQALPGFGPGKTGRILTELGINPHRKFGDLTERQRGILSKRLRGDLPVPPERKCQECGEPLPEGCSARRMFCDDDCRRMFHDGVECVDCGKKTRGGGGGRSTSRCVDCWNELQDSHSRDYFFGALEDFMDRYGRIPAALDWNLGDARTGKCGPERRAEIERAHADRDWPAVSGVQQKFGSWNNFLIEAGVDPVKPGHRRNPEKWAEHLRGPRVLKVAA